MCPTGYSIVYQTITTLYQVEVEVDMEVMSAERDDNRMGLVVSLKRLLTIERFGVSLTISQHNSST